MNLFPILMEGAGPVLRIIEWVSILIEILAISWIFIGILFSTIRYFLGAMRNSPPFLMRYTEYRHTLARTLMLGLEILVAADVVRTVALEPTFESVGVLGLLVLIRIILGWSLVVEIEGHWPWQPARHPENPDS
jgi:uncharacterized membrane protein